MRNEAKAETVELPGDPRGPECRLCIHVDRSLSNVESD